MKTLNLEEAAEFLKMNPEVLRRKAKAKEVPSRKAGKRWLFIKEHLADWVSGRYPERGQTLRVIDGRKKSKEKNKPCLSINAEKVKSGGLTSHHKMESEYAKALGLK